MSAVTPPGPADVQARSMRVERSYRRWLRVYPRPFRDAHGEEVLSTLLDTPGHPPRVRAREVAALTVAGLRCRIATGRRRRPSTVVEGLRWALVVLLFSAAMGGADLLPRSMGEQISTAPLLTRISLVDVAVAVAGLVLATRGKVRAAAAMLVLSRLGVLADNVVVSGGPGEVIGQFTTIDPWLESLGADRCSPCCWPQ